MSLESSVPVRYFVEQKLGKFAHFVFYALLEWIIIVLLFIDGFLTLFCNEFAKFFDLRMPCLLCTRIDHIILRRDEDIYYNDSFCEEHKKDVSSLAYCHVHRKLSEIRTMCEGCLISFATGKEAAINTHKSMNRSFSRNRSFVVAESDDKGNVPRCSCCGEPLKSQSPLQKFIQSSSVTNLSGLAQVQTSTPRATVTWNEEVRNIELPNVRYADLKFMSDTNSDVQDDEDTTNTDSQQSREDAKATTLPSLPDSDDSEDVCKTPIFGKGNRFFGIPLTDSATNSPRWAARLSRKMQMDKMDLFAESGDLDNADIETLKKQLRLDRKSLVALYLELDEERSASDVAANNAMAMITRLQAEKASVQMEALQYQRMMEEQAEYDEEALQFMKDMLLKREDEMKLLEADLDVYRDRFGDLDRIEMSECLGEDFSGFDSDKLDTSLDFESERSRLLDTLANLEQRLNSSSANESEADEDIHEDAEIKSKIRREMSEIRERLRGIEEDSVFLKHAALTLQNDGEGTKLLKEFAQHLQNIRHPEKSTV